MEVFRITHKKWSNRLTASGLAARWNSTGIYVIYTAGSRALACLENVVHRASSGLKAPFITMIISIPDDIIIKELLLEDLPKDWSKSGEIAYNKCRPFGDNWIISLESAVLKVPSAIIPEDYNYLLNPTHPDFSKISILAEDSFTFDERIKKNK
jgi:RES domain-containing protein